METNQPAPTPAPGATSISREDYERLRAEQRLSIALLAGIAAAIIGGIGWAAITFATEYQIGYMAIAVGFLVGFAVRLGKGIDKIFGIVGGLFALIGCLLGNFLSLVFFACKQEHLSVLNALTALDYTKVPAIMSEAFSAMDLLFYGIAVYEGYRFSFRPLAIADSSAPKTT